MSSKINNSNLTPVKILIDTSAWDSYNKLSINSKTYPNAYILPSNGSTTTQFKIKFYDYPSTIFIKNWEIDFGDGSSKNNYTRQQNKSFLVTTTAGNTTVTLNGGSGLVTDQDYYISSSTLPELNQLYFTATDSNPTSAQLFSNIWSNSINYGITSGSNINCTITPMSQTINHKYLYGGPIVFGSAIASSIPITVVGIDNYNRRISYRLTAYLK